MSTLPFVKNDSHEIHYVKLGKGHPIVLLHGVLASSKDWIYHKYPELLSQYTLILVDLRGHGASTKHYDADAYGPKLQASDIKLVLDHLKIPKAIIWGYSFGGRIAFAFGIYYPECVTQLVVGGMHPYRVENVYPAIRKRMSVFTKGMDHWIEYLRSRGIAVSEKEEELLMGNDSQALVSNDESILAWEGFGQQLRNLKTNWIPILLYLGENDRSYVDGAEKFAMSNQNVNLILLEGLNHFTAFSDSETICSKISYYLVT